MREIKFRAWIKGLEEMVEVDELRYFPNEDAHSLELGNIWYTRCNSLTRSMRGIEKVELMQFTGLKDKNGVEIYEGDILDYGYGRGIYVIFAKGKFMACFKDHKGNPMIHLPAYAVIGNIYENPEILEAEE